MTETATYKSIKINTVAAEIIIDFSPDNFLAELLSEVISEAGSSAFPVPLSVISSHSSKYQHFSQKSICYDIFLLQFGQLIKISSLIQINLYSKKFITEIPQNVQLPEDSNIQSFYHPAH